MNNNENKKRYLVISEGTKKIIISLSLSILFPLSSCCASITKNQKNTLSDTPTLESNEVIEPTESKQESVSDTSTDISSQTEITESEKKEPTGIADYIGETEPTITLQDPEEKYQFAYYDIDFGGWEFGFDNPKCNQMLKEYYNDSNLSIADLGYLQEFYSGFYFGEYEPHRNFKDYKNMNFRKEVELYICDELGLRLYVDEIPSEFFEENFSDYIELFEFDYKNDNGNSGYDALIDKLNGKQFDGVYKSTNIDEMMQTLDPQTDEEAFRIVVFNAALNHNITRCEMVYNYNILDSRSDSFDASYVKQVRTTDEKNVLQFKQYQYDAFIKDVQEQECFQFIDDLYKPIDDEDLSKAGIDKDKYDYAFQEVAGIDFDLDYSKKGDSRARTS